MSPTTVDNRAVDMQFNNKEFEIGVQQSTKSLDALKKSLDLSESAKGLNSLAAAGKGFSLANISEGVSNVSSKFSALGVIGFTVLQNLTNAAINFGRKMVDSVLTPMRTGLSEYEIQMNAIQTVLANTESKGTTLDDVNRSLDELNTYADKTIYNFAEMTRNIGTFTAAGVGLETSTAAIKGIANLAAVSGSNSQQASTAMYQLSQALSSGTVKLMDWNSVVNAGMGGQVFQDALKETARVHGVTIDKMIDSEGSFRETLQKGWLTSDILLETLEKFTGDLNAEQLTSMGYTEEQIAGILKLGQTANDAATKVKTFTQLQETLQEGLQSGWAKSWQIVLGDFEEAKALFTEISDTLGPIIEASADARNALLQGWKDMGGRNLLIISLRNTFEGLLSIVAPIKEAFRDIFPALTAKDLFALTRALKDFTEKLKIGGETADKIKRIFTGIFSVLDIVRMGVITLAKAFFELFGNVAPSGGSILDFLANLADYGTRLRESIKSTDFFNVAIQRVKDRIGDFIARLQEALQFLRILFKLNFLRLSSWFNSLFDDIDTSGIEEWFDKINISFEPLKTLGKAVGVIVGGLVRLAQRVAPSLFALGSAIFDFLLKLGTGITEGITSLDFSNLFSAINSGLIAGLILATKKFMDSGTGFMGEATGIFGNIASILDGVRGSLEAWQQNLKAKTLLSIAAAIGILAVSLLILSGIDGNKLAVAVGAVTAMFIELMGAMGIFSKVSGTKGSLGASVGLMAMATSILIMSFAVSKLAKIKPEEMEQALGAVVALSVGMAALSRAMGKNSGNILKGSVGLVAFSIALLIIAESVKKLGALDPAEMTNGLIGVGVMLAEVAAFMKLADFNKMGVTKGVGLIAMAAAILLMSVAIEKLGTLDAAKLQQGLVALGAVLAEVGIFTRLTGNGANMVLTAIGMTILGAAVLIFAEAITRFGKMKWEEIQRGLTAMGLALLIIFAAVKMMPNNMILTGVALVIVASSLLILAEALRRMGDMEWDEIQRGLVALGGALAILSIALYAMAGTLPGSLALVIAAGAILLLAPALAMLGQMQLSEIGLALLTLAGVFLILGIAGYALTPVVPTLLGLGASMLLIGLAAIGVGVGLLAFSAGLAALAISGTAGAVAIVAMVSILLGIIPMVIKTLVEAIILFAKLITEAAPIVGEAITALLIMVLNIIIDVTPKLLEALGVLLDGLIELIFDKVPSFLEAVWFLLDELLSTLAAHIPEFVQSGFDILIGFLEGIRDNIGEVVTVAIEIVTEFLDAVADKIPDVIDSGFNLIVEFINGLADAVEKQGPALNEAIGNLAAAIVKGLCDGLVAGTRGVMDAIGKLAGAAVKALKTLLGIFSPSKVFSKLGEAVPVGFANGILKLESKVKTATENMGNKAVDGMSKALSNIKDAFVSDLDMDPVITPVVDLTDVISSGAIIDKLMSKKTFDIVPSVSRTAMIATSMPGSTISDAGIVNPTSTISLVQNNYSPKALSRVDIYRQTKNQLLTLKGMVV